MVNFFVTHLNVILCHNQILLCNAKTMLYHELSVSNQVLLMDLGAE
jgi:hypothetical protein